MRTKNYISLVVLTLIGWCFSAAGVRAQDMHFSQFTNATQLYNPSLTGQYEQTIKVSLLHRSQWRSVGTGFKTNAFDGQYKILNMYSKNYFGTGIAIFQDKAGIADIKTFMMSASAAYHVVVSDFDLFSAGLQFGFIQRSLQTDGLAWDSQFDGFTYDPNLDSQERFVNQSRGVGDLGLGVNWKHRSLFGFNMGYGVRHTRQDLTVLMKSSDKYAIRHSLSVGYTQPLRQAEIQLDALIQRQAGAMELLLGGSFNYKIGDDSRYTNVKTSSLLTAGMYYRVKDAIHPFVGFRYKRTALFSFGYDLRVSKLGSAPGMPGGPEINLTYLGTVGRSRMRIMH